MRRKKGASDEHYVPVHVAIIMDGNRRWAERRGLPAAVGHRQGVASIESVLSASIETGVRVLTLYTFSTENWRRSRREVSTLMRLLERHLDVQRDRLMRNRIRFRTIGRLDRLNPGLQKRIHTLTEATASFDRITLNLALDYGGRDEIVHAARCCAREAIKGMYSPERLTQERLAAHLHTAGLPDPDLLIRTGGEYRISNFLLWQISYSELYLTRRLWPDFRAANFKKAIDFFSERHRRFGA